MTDKPKTKKAKCESRGRHEYVILNETDRDRDSICMHCGLVSHESLK